MGVSSAGEKWFWPGAAQAAGIRNANRNRRRERWVDTKNTDTAAVGSARQQQTGPVTGPRRIRESITCRE